jgi:hypothetical protein
MAFDSFLPRGDTAAALPKNGDDSSEPHWARSRQTADGDDVSYERPSRSPLAGRSVTLWDEVSPVPRAMSDAMCGPNADPPDE